METGVAHLAAVVTDLTCPPDIHSQSSFSSALQLQNHCPSPLPPSSSSPSISLNLHSFILNSFCVLILRLLFSCSVPVSAFPSSTFSSYPLILFPFSLLPFSPSDSWVLTAFYISFFSATAREQPGIRGLVQTNRRPCGSPRVATRHNKPPAPGRRRHMVHRAPLRRRAGAKRDLPFWFPWQPDSNISRCEVRSDGRWKLMYWTTWWDNLTCTRWNHKQKREGECLFWSEKEHVRQILNVWGTK